ncbi:MAG: acyl-CoA/acyl-ACP dehydrogenase [Deltaproteobacteria bacterium]|nr:acyl-CoA/acyl-ACP dehydrogenase [Deltaproteobacteria bacterium]
MNFRLTKAQKEIQKAAVEFARGEFDKEMIIEKSGIQEFPEKICRKAADLGFVGINFPEKFDGGGMGLFEYVLLAEAFCKKDSTLGMALLFSALGGECLFAFEENRATETYLPKIALGETRCSAAFFEPGMGSDLTKIETHAFIEGEDWILNGKKAYVINGANSDIFIVLCRTGENEEGASGMSMIAVEAQSPGVDVKPAGMQLGARLSPFAHVTLENVRVPKANIAGKAGDGYIQALSFLAMLRVQIAGIALGTAQGALDRAIDYIKNREQFGKKIGLFQVTRHKIADMTTQVDAARALTHFAALHADTHKIDEKTAATAKIFACRAAMAITDEAVQLLGGYGYMTEYELEHFYRDAKALEVLGGAPGTLRDIISDQVIGRIK